VYCIGAWDGGEERTDAAGARIAYRRAIALEPDRAPTYVSLGSIERKEGDADLARRLYDTALVVDPGASYARSAGGSCGS